MKKHIILPALMAALMGMASCSNMDECGTIDNAAPASGECRIAFSAAMCDGGLAKTAMSGNGAIDLLGNETMTVVADDKKNTVFTVSNSTDDKGTFSGYLPQEANETASNFVAMYPEGSFSAEGYGMTIPTEQTAVANSFDPKANLLIAATAKGSDMKFSLSNVCSFIKITVPSPVASLTVSANENIAGDITVSTDGTCDGGTSNTVTLKPATEGSTIAAGTYYIAVKPGAVSGLKISSNVYADIASASFTLARAKTHDATLKGIKSASLDAYLKSLELAENEVATVYLADYDNAYNHDNEDYGVINKALRNNDTKNVKLILPESVTSIGNRAFVGCRNLVSIEMPNVTSIGEYDFEDCSSLVDISMPKVTSIRYAAFDGCSSLVDISMPNVTSIGYAAFFDCSSLALTELPSGVTSIGDYAFSGCTSLALTSLPTGVTSIGQQAFASCSSLVLTSLPKGVTSIRDKAFYKCGKLKTLTIESTPTIGDNVFDYCASDLVLNVTKATYDTYHNKYPMMVPMGYDKATPGASIESFSKGDSF